MASDSDMDSDMDSDIDNDTRDKGYKDYSTPSYGERAIVLPKRRRFSRIRVNLISKIKEFNNDIIEQRDISEFQITAFDKNIVKLKKQIHGKTLQNINSKYSYKSNGKIYSGLSFIQSETQLIIESVVTFFNKFTSIVSETTDLILLQIALELLNLISEDLTLYNPSTVTLIVKKFKKDLYDMKNKNNEFAALIRAADLAAEIRMNDRIERSRIKNIALEKEEDEKLSRRLFQSKQSNHGGKSMKPKQHRNSKTQKKRQRKNQKK
jgi:hypothetical protein